MLQNQQQDIVTNDMKIKQALTLKNLERPKSDL